LQKRVRHGTVPAADLHDGPWALRPVPVESDRVTQPHGAVDVVRGVGCDEATGDPWSVCGADVRKSSEWPRRASIRSTSGSPPCCRASAPLPCSGFSGRTTPRASPSAVSLLRVCVHPRRRARRPASPYHAARSQAEDEVGPEHRCHRQRETSWVLAVQRGGQRSLPVGEDRVQPHPSPVVGRRNGGVIGGDQTSTQLEVAVGDWGRTAEVEGAHRYVATQRYNRLWRSRASRSRAS
jgi:hypothetical protein